MNDAKNNLQYLTRNAAKEIDGILREAMIAADSISDDLTKGRLKSDDRIKNRLKETI